MQKFFQSYHYVKHMLNGLSTEALPLLARFIFASTLFMFFWRAAMTKLGDGFLGLFIPADGAYGQILPLRYEAAGYDVDALGFFDWLIVFAGTWGEILLPIMIVLGLWTRVAALGMIGFIVVLSIFDVFAHGVAAGAMFDGNPMGIVADQRLYWGLGLAILLFHGAGKLSLDQLLCKFTHQDTQQNTLQD